MSSRVFILAAAGLCVVGRVAGRAGAGEVCVQTTDPSGAPAAEAGLTIRDTQGNVRQGVTGADGRYCFPSIAPGVYSLAVTHADFEGDEKSIRIQAANVEVGLRLRVRDLRQRLDVTSQDNSGPSTQDNATQIVFEPETLERLPALGRDVVAVLSEWLDMGSAGSGEATVVVDGVEVPASSVKPALIEQVRINRNPYSPEFARPGRGRIEISTKSGTKDYHGSFRSSFRDSALDARNPFAIRKPEERRQTYEASLSGPLGRRRRDSFVTAFSQEAESLQSLVFARTLAGEVRANVRAPAADTELAAGWIRPTGEAGTLSVRYEYDAETANNRGAGGFRLPETGFDRTENTHETKVGWQGVLGKIVLESALQLERSAERDVSITPAGVRLVVEDAFTSGSAQADASEKSTQVRINQVLSWARGAHLFRVGYQLPGATRYAISNSLDTLGVFRFAGLEQFAAGRPYSYSVQASPAAAGFWQVRQAAFFQDDWQARPGLAIGLGLRWAWQNAIAGRSDFAPRASLAWAPGAKRKTVIRAGMGIFHDTLDSSAMANTMLLDGTGLRRLLIANPGYPDPFVTGGGQRQVPSNIYRLAPRLRSPYLLESTIGIERLWSPALTTAVQYVESRGGALFRSRDRNAPLAKGLPRPDPNIGVAQTVESEGSMSGHALEMSLRARAGRKLTITAQYRTAWYKNDTGGINWFPADSYAPDREWARADFDARRRFVAIAGWEPWRATSFGCIFRASTGTPYSMTTGGDDNGDGFARDRPSGIGRNTLETPAVAALDLRISRETRLKRIKETDIRGRFALDAFNVLNRTNYASFSGALSSPYFGLPVAARPARRLQISFQLSF